MISAFPVFINKKTHEIIRGLLNYNSIFPDCLSSFKVFYKII
jgi:hypothetical protein